MSRPRRRMALLAPVVLLVGCSGANDWTKPGGNDAATRAEYDDCRSLADAAVQVDTNIDQDIIATRGADLQRGSVVRTQAQVMQEHSRDRAGAIIDKCMAAKGFVRTP